MSDVKKAFEALDRLKSIIKNPRGWGEYSQFTDSLELFKKDIRAIENVMPKPGTMRKKIRHAQAFYVNEYGESRIDMPSKEKEQTDLLISNIAKTLVSLDTNKNFTNESALTKIIDDMIIYYIGNDVNYLIRSEPKTDGVRYVVTFPDYPGITGGSDNVFEAIDEAKEALSMLKKIKKEK